MASTFSPNLRIELIGAGEQAGAWNNTTNTNLGTLIEQAITGVESITVGGSDVTLTTADGATDQARNMVLILTGSPGASRNIIAPDLDKVYIVRNDTANSHTIKTSSGSVGVSVPAYSSAIVFCDEAADGGNGSFYNAVKDLASGSTIAGAAIVTTSGDQTLTDKTLTSPKIGTAILDTGGNRLFSLTATGSAVNYMTVANAAASSSPSITAAGTDTNIDLLLAAKGTGVVKAGGVEVVTLTGTQALSNKTLTAPKFADLGFIADANGNELIVMDTVTSAVNEIKVANAATAGTPTISAQGDDTNVSLNLVTKGTGTLQYNGNEIVTSVTANSSTENAQTGTTYTLVLSDASKTVTMTNASSNTLTVPPNASVAFPIGTRVDVIQYGAGQTTIAAGSGVTIYKYSIASGTNAKLAGQYAAGTLWKKDTNTWVLVGNLTT